MQLPENDPNHSSNVRVWVAVGYRGVNIELKVDKEWTGVSLNEKDVEYLITSLAMAKTLWGERPLDDVV